jgi:Tol biopolymer transport system component
VRLLPTLVVYSAALFFIITIGFRHVRSFVSLADSNAAVQSNPSNHATFGFLHSGAVLYRESIKGFRFLPAMSDNKQDKAAAAAAFSVFAPPIPQSGDSKIVFATNRDGSMQIYVMDGDGSAITRLTFSGANDDYPRWSPNGTKILFQSDRDHPDTGYMDIYVMNSDGSGVTRLTNDPNDDGMASWSPDGSKIVFQSMRNGVNYQVYSMNADGSNQANLSNSASSDGEPSWSPDGTKIAFATDRDHASFDSIYEMNVDGSNPNALTSETGEMQDTQPVWSPDSSKIAFVSTRDSITETWQETDDDGNYITRSKLHINKEIYVMNGDGSGQTRLTNEPANDDSPSWSPLGLTILFRSDRERDCCDPTAQIWSMNADGTNQLNLSNDGSNEYSASLRIDASSSATQAVNMTGTNQVPVANAGGSYSSQSGDAVQLNGSHSFDPDGTIVNYAWDFGDGTSGNGAIINHQYAASGVYPVSLTVTDNNGNTSSSQGFVNVDSVALPVKINFETLPNGTPIPNGAVISDQYLKDYGVLFSSGNPFFPVHTYQNCGPCSTTSPPNFINTKPDDSGVMSVKFTQPVSNLTFFMIGVDAFFNQFAILDVYRNGNNTAPFATYPILGNGTFTSGITLGTLDNISMITVRGINDPNGIGFDDFSFTVPADVKITSGRVNEFLNGTTQKALLGADVALNASPLPGAFAGGTYSWSFAGSPTPVTPMNQASATVRWTQPGTYRGTVTYTKGTQTATAVVDVEVIIPTLLGVVANESSDRLTRDVGCNNHPFGVWYTLGCFERLFPTGPVDGPLGITWLAIAQIPTATYLSNPAQSGIKFVQALSTYNKRRHKGNTDCLTARSSELNVDSGWQLDTTDPYNNTKYFSEGSTLTLDDNDNPFTQIEMPVTQEGFYSDDAHYVDDRFEVYLYYFTTNASNQDPTHPIFQQPLGLPNSPPGMPISRLSWSWGGLVVFDYYSFPPSLTYTLTSNTVPGSIVATPATVTRSISTNFKDLQWRPCGTGVTSNPIDTSYYFVEKLYTDFLQRPAEPDGEDFWRSNITQCVFDETCIGNKRIDVARAFFYSTEFVGLHPDLAGQRGTHDYNSGFVYACYRGFLRREPNASPDNNWNGFNFWVAKLDSSNPDAGDWKYNEMLKAFLESIEYRARFEPLVP